MKARRIAAIFDSLGNYQQKILDGINTVLQPQDIPVIAFIEHLINNNTLSNMAENSIFNLLNHSDFDGVIIASGCLTHNTTTEELIEFASKWDTMPVVSAGILLPNFDSVYIDNYSGMQSLVEHLIQNCGHEKFAFLQGPPNNLDSTEREEAFRQALQDNKILLSEELVARGWFQSDRAYVATDELLQSGQEFDVLVAANDQMAHGAIRAINKHGLRVPEDIAVVGFDDDEDSNFCIPPLTTVSQPIEDIGREAAKLILSRNSRDFDVRATRLKTELVVRKSCKATQYKMPFPSTKQSFIIEDSQDAQIQEIYSALKETEWYSPEIESLLTTLLKQKNDFLTQWYLYVQDLEINKITYLNLKVFLESIVGLCRSKNGNTTLLDFDIYLECYQILFDKYSNSLEKDNFTELLVAKDSLSNFHKQLRLVSMKSLDELFDALGDYLKLEAERCFIVLYDQISSGIAKKGELRLAVAKEVMDLGKQDLFDTKMLLPEDFQSELKGKLYLVPIVTDAGHNEYDHYGYMLLENTKHHRLIPHENIAHTIAVALRNLAQVKTVYRRTQQLEEANAELITLANYDALTGLPNRFLFHKELDGCLDEALVAQTKLAVLFLDLDGFKYVNDSMGHEAGDQLLVAVAKRLKNQIKSTDFVARLGGDEFIVVLKDIGHEDTVIRVAESLVKSISSPFQIQEHMFRVTASIGIAMFPDDGSDTNELLKFADAAMYQAKLNGKNSYQFYTDALNQHALERIHIGQGIQEAIENHDFYLVYQPRFGLSDSSLESFEALIRWEKDGEFIPPSTFIPIAEDLGLIHKIGDYVLKSACLQAKEWLRKGLSTRIAVNLSAVQLQDDDVVKKVVSTLDEAKLDPKHLELEITESAAMKDVTSNFEKLQALQDLGIKIAIDDFGTAYSSLNYLKLLPVSSLKIDKSFVQDIEDAEDISNNTAIIRAIIALGKSMGYTVIAEGVETEAQKRFLQNHQCDEVQGFYFARPLSVSDAEALLAKKYNTNTIVVGA